MAEGQKLVSTNRQLVNQLQNFISERVEAGKITSIEAARQSDTSIENGKLFYSQLLGSVLLRVWLYGRLFSLEAMAEGRLDTHIATQGRDEIYAMARRRNLFRQEN